MRRSTSIFISLFILSLALLPYAKAEIRVTIPSFPSCVDPEGLVIASYKEGVHGVPGDLETHYGSDTVFKLSEDTLSQCLCEENDNGIQTNWWKVSSLSIEEIEYLQQLGWVYVPDGSDWGLDEAPYMAYNLSFDCSSDNEDNDDDDDDRSDEEDDNDDRVGGIVGEMLSTSTVRSDTLGLASTGDSKVFLSLIVAGILFMSSSLILLSKKRG